MLLIAGGVMQVCGLFVVAICLALIVVGIVWLGADSTGRLRVQRSRTAFLSELSRLNIGFNVTSVLGS
jgi:hypothetical protein